MTIVNEYFLCIIIIIKEMIMTVLVNYLRVVKLILVSSKYDSLKYYFEYMPERTLCARDSLDYDNDLGLPAIAR